MVGPSPLIRREGTGVPDTTWASRVSQRSFVCDFRSGPNLGSRCLGNIWTNYLSPANSKYSYCIYMSSYPKRWNNGKYRCRTRASTFSSSLSRVTAHPWG